MSQAWIASTSLLLADLNMLLAGPFSNPPSYLKGEFAGGAQPTPDYNTFLQHFLWPAICCARQVWAFHLCTFVFSCLLNCLQGDLQEIVQY